MYVSRRGTGTRSSHNLLQAILLHAACSLKHATAQIGPAFGPELISNCNLGALDARIAKLNDACCLGQDECDRKCDTNCVAVLIPLMEDCGVLLAKLFDGADGKEDGNASVFESVYSDCLDMPSAQILSALKELQSKGQCPDVVLDGIAATEVAAAPCRDTWMNSAGCGMAIASGILSCEKNFCSAPPTLQAPCDLAGHCDKTCGFCEDATGQDGHRRRMLDFLWELSRRRAQIQLGQCLVGAFEAEIARVNDACCDLAIESTVCATGVPSSCDAKCAVVYNDFYGRCNRLLAAQLDLETLSKWGELFSTCTHSLPKLPLLRALALCSTAAPAPIAGCTDPSAPNYNVGATEDDGSCADVDDCTSAPCENGSACMDAGGAYSCTCNAGYDGDNCGVDYDECGGAPCENDAICTDAVGAYTCTCSAGYEGDSCGVDYDECASGPCRNGGVCTDGVASYLCACMSGYECDNCDSAIFDPCASVECGAPSFSPSLTYTILLVSLSICVYQQRPNLSWKGLEFIVISLVVMTCRVIKIMKF